MLKVKGTIVSISEIRTGKTFTGEKYKTVNVEVLINAEDDDRIIFQAVNANCEVMDKKGSGEELEAKLLVTSKYKNGYAQHNILALEVK